MGEVEEKRLVLVLTDELQGPVGEKVSQVFTFLDLAGRSSNKLEMATVGDKCLLKATNSWMMLRPISEVPLAEHARGIAGLLEHLGDRHLIQR